MLKKLFIMPYFGDYPVWIDSYLEHIKHLKQYGYDFYLTKDQDDFKDRVRKRLEFIPNIRPNTPILHNYRTAFGIIYEDIIGDYDFWGITDFDCAYGKVDNFITDKQLENLDIHSNHHNYICGPWTLFRNNGIVNNLFRKVPSWEAIMNDTQRQAGRWTEVEFSQTVDELHDAKVINRLYTHYQGIEPNDDSDIKFDGVKLYDHGQEIMMWHGNRNKRWVI